MLLKTYTANLNIVKISVLQQIDVYNGFKLVYFGFKSLSMVYKQFISTLTYLYMYIYMFWCDFQLID